MKKATEASRHRIPHVDAAASLLTPGGSRMAGGFRRAAPSGSGASARRVGLEVGGRQSSGEHDGLDEPGIRLERHAEEPPIDEVR
jgi:hypothetical protein